MIRAVLKKWIAQSSSWETFKEFKLNPDQMAKYDFLPRYEDFFISLVGTCHEVLTVTPPPENKNEILSDLAAGLQIYHLAKMADNFTCVEKDKALLYSSTLYYLSGYPTTSCYLARLIKFSAMDTALEVFLFNFLNRKRFRNSELEKLFNNFLDGNLDLETDLRKTVRESVLTGFKQDADDYFTAILVQEVLELFFRNFSKTILRQIGKDRALTSYTNSLIEKSDGAIWEFLPTQRLAIASGILDSNNTVTLQMPTSAGKTALSELVIFNFHKENPTKKALFLAPFRALASELKQGFCYRLSRLGLKTKTIYGGGTASATEVEGADDADLIVSTPEKYLSLEAADPEIASKIGLVICDEGHLLDASERGLSYELLLSRFKRTETTERKMVFISAIVPNIESIHTWLGGTTAGLVSSNYRPSKIDYCFIDKVRNGNFKLTVNPTKQLPEKFFLDQFISKKELVFINQETGRPNTYNLNTNLSLAAYTGLKSVPTGLVALFTTQKGYVREILEKALDQLSHLTILNPVTFCNLTVHRKYKLYWQFLIGENSQISRGFNAGIAIHHGDMPQSIREKIEGALRDGGVKLVICTNTLAEGVNLPIRTLVIHTVKRFDNNSGRQVPIKLRDLKNIVGRAGRAEKSLKGTVILVNKNDQEQMKRVINGVGMEDVEGSLWATIKKLNVEFQNGDSLTNEQISKSADETQRMVEHIDMALISLVKLEEPNITEVDADTLAQKTYAHSRLDTSGKTLLRNLFRLRVGTLGPFIESGEIQTLKEAMLSPMQFSRLTELVNVSFETVPLLQDDPSSVDCISFYVDIITAHKPFAEELQRFNRSYETQFGPEVIKKIMKSWMSGASYHETALSIGLTVDIVLAFISVFFGYHFQRTVYAINMIALKKLNNPDAILGFGMEKFGECLLLGCNKSLQLDIFEAGLTDRNLIIEAEKWLRRKEAPIMSKSILKSFIHANKRELIDFLSATLPELLLEEAEDSIESMAVESIL